MTRLGRSGQLCVALALCAVHAGCSLLEEHYECGQAGELSRESGTRAVFGGGDHPTEVPLTPGQVLAVGSFQICTGTLIADDWVITARHCLLRAGDEFCIGERPDAPDQCIPARRSISHPDADARLVQLASPASTRLPAVEPVAVMTEALDCGWLGAIAEAAGYGETELGEIGTRLFVAEPIVKLTRHVVRIDGRGRSGLCLGDSGGPAFVVASDGAARVAGVLSIGHPTCRDFDDFTRVDAIQDWIADVTGIALD